MTYPSRKPFLENVNCLASTILYNVLNTETAGKNYTMTNKDIDEVFDIIRKSDRDDLTNLDGLSRDRVDIILPGAKK
jgi:exopolyphosphatase/pppGpp-phosphohydrolase